MFTAFQLVQPDRVEEGIGLNGGGGELHGRDRLFIAACVCCRGCFAPVNDRNRDAIMQRASQEPFNPLT